MIDWRFLKHRNSTIGIPAVWCDNLTDLLRVRTIRYTNPGLKICLVPADELDLNKASPILNITSPLA